MPSEIVVLHTVEDAEHIVSARKSHHPTSYLYATHPAVVSYLDQLHRLECNMLTAVLPKSRVSEIWRRSLAKSEHALAELDNQHAQAICQSNDLAQIGLFTALYLHLYNYRCGGNAVIIEAIHSAIRLHQANRLLLYKHPESRHLRASLNATSTDIEIREIDSATQKTAILKTAILKTRARHVVRTLYHWLNPVRQFPNILFHKRQRKTIGYLAGLYDFSKIVPSLPAHNVYFYPNQSIAPIFFPRRFSINSTPIPLVDQERGRSIVTRLLNDCIKDYNTNGNHYLQSLKIADHLVRKKSLSGCLLGNGATQGVKSLLATYLKAIDVTVLDYQHGCCYGYSDPHLKHFVTDYNKCDCFFSYGFTKAQLIDYYSKFAPQTDIEKKLSSLTIIPAGKPTPPRRIKKNLAPIQLFMP